MYFDAPFSPKRLHKLSDPRWRTRWIRSSTNVRAPQRSTEGLIYEIITQSLSKKSIPPRRRWKSCICPRNCTARRHNLHFLIGEPYPLFSACSGELGWNRDTTSMSATAIPMTVWRVRNTTSIMRMARLVYKYSLCINLRVRTCFQKDIMCLNGTLLHNSDPT